MIGQQLVNQEQRTAALEAKQLELEQRTEAIEGKVAILKQPTVWQAYRKVVPETEEEYHTQKLVDLCKRLEQSGKSSWVKSKQLIDCFPKKKRPTAVEARHWMQVAANLGKGELRGEGNRLEFKAH